MQQVSHNSPLALAYAQSLLELAGDSDQAEAVGGELRDLREVIEKNPAFGTFLSDPSISDEDRTGLLKKVLADQVSKLMMNFLMVVAEKHRLGSLPAISAAYDELLDKQLGKVEVDVIVAQRLTPDALETVRRRVSAALKRDAVVHPYVDESIIGGMILRVQDQLIDGSIRTQLKTIRQRMIAARPK